ncbi:MAG: YceD family protein [Nocardioides sp.]|uniref:YceD family protein n=1 Tax=Nocardioides sp. TaxID=35761 RepID=UPI003F067D3A
MTSLDPRAPLVLDTRELGRRPGSQREEVITVPAPAELGIEVLHVPEGAPVEIDLRLEAVVEGVLVTGTVQAGLEGECVRCLEPIDDDVVAKFQELYVYEDQHDKAVEHDDHDLDDETNRLEDDLLDLEPLLRDAVVLALPFQPLCQEDCEGLCAECGTRLLDEPGHTHDAPIDPRWAGLAGLQQETQD